MEQLSGVSASPSRSADFQSISICPNRRRPRESLVLVLVIGNGAVEDEDEKEDDDDWVAAPPRCAVSQVFNLPPGACEQRSADYKSATCLPADRYGRLKICATLNTCQPQVPLLAGLSIPKSRRPGEDVAVVGSNFDLLAGRDVFLATGNQSFTGLNAGSYDG